MAQQKPERPFNLRAYQGKIERELVIGGIIITVALGGGLIALIWGRDAFFAALGCFALVVALRRHLFIFERAGNFFAGIKRPKG